MSSFCKRISCGTVLTLVSISGILADTHLVISAPDGPLPGVSLVDITQISFNGNQMNITTKNGDKVFNIPDVRKITFDFEASGLDNIETSLEDITIVSCGGIMKISSSTGTLVDVDVYTIGGILVKSRHDAETVSIDFNFTAPGIYIVKANNKIIKYNCR